MRFGGLGLLERDSGGGLTLVSWHHPHSMTWGWLVSIRRDRIIARDDGRPRFSLRAPVNYEGLREIHVAVPSFVFSIKRQRPMFYRDLYQKLVDARHRTFTPARPVDSNALDGTMSSVSRELAEARSKGTLQ